MSWFVGACWWGEVLSAGRMRTSQLIQNKGYVGVGRNTQEEAQPGFRVKECSCVSREGLGPEGGRCVRGLYS